MRNSPTITNLSVRLVVQIVFHVSVVHRRVKDFLTNSITFFSFLNIIHFFQHSAFLRAGVRDYTINWLNLIITGVIHLCFRHTIMGMGKVGGYQKTTCTLFNISSRLALILVCFSFLNFDSFDSQSFFA